jgi:hypothetical protein
MAGLPWLLPTSCRPLNFAVTVEQDGKKVTLREPNEIRRLIGGHPDDEHRAYLQIVDYLVRHGIDVNARLLETDQTPLFMPAESGQADVLALMLLGSGVNVNHRDKKFNCVPIGTKPNFSYSRCASAAAESQHRSYPAAA